MKLLYRLPVLAALFLFSCVALLFGQDVTARQTLLPAHYSSSSTEQFAPPAEPITQLADDLPRAQALELFRAILLRDYERLRDLLAQGIWPDIELPPGPPEDYLRLLPDTRLVYYAQHEQGFTALMLAAALGDREAVRILLQNGADRWKKTKRHRTFALWLGAKTGDVELIRELMALQPGGEWSRHEIRVSLSMQSMRLLRDGETILESPISSGKKSNPTRTGRFVVTDKHRNWKSTLYNVPMPFFVRLSCSDFGFHAGRLPGYPASHGCIRLPKEKAKQLFETVPLGTLVVIEE
jgi:hypothetical protein